jgi:hypothetical protein
MMLYVHIFRGVRVTAFCRSWSADHMNHVVVPIWQNESAEVRAKLLRCDLDDMQRFAQKETRKTDIALQNMDRSGEVIKKRANDLSILMAAIGNTDKDQVLIILYSPA